jgi:hypothetical protein
MMLQRLSLHSRQYGNLHQNITNASADFVIQQLDARGFSSQSGVGNNEEGAPSNPINRLFSIVQTFNTGLGKLKSDFFNSLHIQEAEVTRLFLQRKIRQQYEQQRDKLRSHEKHGIHILIQERSGLKPREVSFIPSTVFTHSIDKSRNNNNKHLSYPEQNYYASRGTYLSTRRPKELVRQVSRDRQTTLPTVAAFVFIPFVGYSFLLLGMMFPRLLLSRQFHTKKQREYFATKEFEDRRRYFERLNTDFWGSCMRNMPRLVLLDEKEKKNSFQPDSIPLFLEPMTYQGTDAGGPLLTETSIGILYRLFHRHLHSGSVDNMVPSISSLQNTHIHSLSLANNLAAPLILPSSLSPLFLQNCLPMRYLQYKLKTLAEDIIMDDASLIEEGQIDIKCGGMTEEEVLNACWLRGLPMGRYACGGENQVQVMRNLLTSHLQMMQYAHRSVGEDTINMSSRSKLVRDETLQLL